MCGCFALFVGAAFPRLSLVVLELFTDYNDRAFDSFGVGLIGWLLLPYTSLLYVLMENWQDPIDGFGWFVVAFGFLLDLGHYFGAGANRHRWDRRAV